MNTLSEGLLLKGQREWIADPSPLKVIEKGRRTGITWAEAADDVLIASTNRADGGQHVYYFPQAKDDAIEYIETCAKWARAFDKAAGTIETGAWEEELGVLLPRDDPDKGIQTYKIAFPSGNRIVALSSAPSRARGKQGVFVLDEAAFHPDLSGVLKAVMATVLRGGRVRVISTHNGEDNPFNELIQEIRSGRRAGTVHRYPFEQAVRDGMYRRICELGGERWTAEAEREWVRKAYALYGDDAGEELDAVPQSGSGTFLSGVLIESRMTAGIPILRLEFDDHFASLGDAERTSAVQAWLEDHADPLLEGLDPGLDCSYGWDFGRTGDLSVFAPLQEGRDLVRRAPFLLEMRNVPFRQQEQILFHIVDRLPRFRYGAHDGRGNGQALAEYAWQRYGQGRIAIVMLSTEWYREHMPAFKASFEDATIEIPRDADVLRDLRSIRMDKGVAKVPDNARTTGTDGKQRHGDAGIALALADFASRQDAAPIEYRSTGPRRSYGADLGVPIAPRRMREVGFGAVGGGPDLGGF
ncbi:MAG TPA: hypothetical protein VFA86_13870 [Gammaproteobacteria bacterium]|nr:hypothetical protein [Gammaproteobacteria bacterium]